MKIAALALLAAFGLTACEEVVERPAVRHHRHVTYVSDRPYYDDAPRRYYDDSPTYQTYESRRYYSRPGARVIIRP